jgi:hypothetical protein
MPADQVGTGLDVGELRSCSLARTRARLSYLLLYPRVLKVMRERTRKPFPIGLLAEFLAIDREHVTARGRFAESERVTHSFNRSGGTEGASTGERSALIPRHVN